MDVNISDWTEKYADDRGIIRAAMSARKKKMARYLSEEAFRRGTTDNVTVRFDEGEQTCSVVNLR